MTKKDKLVYYCENDLTKIETNSNKSIIDYLSLNKIQKLPIVNNKDQMKVVGLITLKDMLQRCNQKFINYANLDHNSQLRVGCAIGVNKDYLEKIRPKIKKKIGREVSFLLHQKLDSNSIILYKKISR